MTFHLGVPQLIYLALWIYAIVDETIKHGKPRSPHNVWTTLAALPIILALLFWGGVLRVIIREEIDENGTLLVRGRSLVRRGLPASGAAAGLRRGSRPG